MVFSEHSSLEEFFSEHSFSKHSLVNILNVHIVSNKGDVLVLYLP